MLQYVYLITYSLYTFESSLSDKLILALFSLYWNVKFKSSLLVPSIDQKNPHRFLTFEVLH